MSESLITNTVTKINHWTDTLEDTHVFSVSGQVTQMIGLTLEVVGLQASVGSLCKIILSKNNTLMAEVVGFRQEKLLLMPLEDSKEIAPGMQVYCVRKGRSVLVGDALLGRVVNARGEAIDNKGVVPDLKPVPLHSQPTNPLLRQPIDKLLDVGVRAINGLLTIGEGQRIGLFAGSGVGKSVLLGMITRYAKADVVVVGLIGERGREVNEFIQNTLGEEGLRKSVIVAEPADSAPILRMQGASTATRIAEYFRDQGKSVLLIMDSLTRFAHAEREIGMAVGEPLAAKGYTPSVFAKLPKILERAGRTEHSGSITGIYTVLMEGDDEQDPIVDCARSILDGHIVLSRSLAEQGVYPAIDVQASISRVMPMIVEESQYQAAIKFKSLYSAYMNNRDLISVGAYAKGQDQELDKAIAIFPQLQAFIKQTRNAPIYTDEAREVLKRVTELSHE